MSRNKNQNPTVDKQGTEDSKPEKKEGYKILKSFKGSPNGAIVFKFEEGDTVTHDELGDDLAKVTKDNNWIK